MGSHKLLYTTKYIVLLESQLPVGVMVNEGLIDMPFVEMGVAKHLIFR